MARPSKYETMAKMKQVVKMSFADVKVTGYRNPKVTSKTGREYRKYEVEVDNVLWVSTTSFNKQSFSRRYFKALENIEVVQEEQPVKETPTKKRTKKRTVKKEKSVEVKEQPRYSDEVQRMFDEFEKREIQRLIDDLHEACMFGRNSVQETFERCVHNIKTFDNYSSISGSTIYNSFEEYFNYWNTWYIERYINEVEENKDNDWHYTFHYSKLSEWIKEFSPKFKKVVEEEWINVEQRRKVFQDQWRKDHWGSDWEQRWERENFSSSVDFNENENEYDEKFKDCKTVKDVKRVYRQLAKMTHSDTGGSDEEFIKVKEAYDRALQLVA